ncbi:MAG: hypothetical protein JGK04_08475 [Microcoleus sp. PH2017_39_LGB_O_B]|uniref:hypothetical protein n=1 Tax=unclassified Microcoleus TaxID=2642155 RepID=UPI001DBADD96|nr:MULTISPECIES: hypothetical protein [unclassified Microcoleus]MCC3447457.1 hypothetical protein [Microcoleus sp. PH2017_09_SFU_O_A]MCC3628469.1 hypothetical protein [Microcoleus sp. PH2017_39_LGB_O_B]MCC3640544.1 hypothetical protein [Microcoleus sp. PH2017_33_LGB_O_A]
MTNKRMYNIVVTGVGSTAIISSLGVVLLAQQGKSVSGCLELALAALASLTGLLVTPPEK